ncbi:MAG: PKD domain-containing protein [candidate division Zixibacteria bacterium]|nr:PKD domain-containing protein [candidate division Zixibacteria bacterium]
MKPMNKSLTGLACLAMLALALICWTDECYCAPQCSCPNQGDVEDDFNVDVFDVIATIGIVYQGREPGITDPDCSTARSDANADGVTDAVDIVYIRDIAFSGGTSVDPCLGLVSPAPTLGGTLWSVTVESKQVLPGSTNQTIAIRLTNDAPVRQLVVPLVIRSVTAGTSISSLKLGVSERLTGSAPQISVLNQYASGEGSCKSGNAGGYSTIAFNDGESHPVTASPMAVLFAQGWLFGGGFAAGSDVSGSLVMTVDVNSTPGIIEIDTTCTNPGNHLLFVPLSTYTPVLPTFAKGLISVFGPNDHAATINHSAPSGNPPRVVSFDGVTPEPADSWEWLFGDGTTGSGKNTYHGYPGTGSYSAAAMATVGDQKYYAMAQIIVNGIVAGFSASTDRAGESPLTVQFTDLSSGGPTAWSWDFGDGTPTSTEQNPAHTYTTNGWFNVRLTASKFADSSMREKLNYVHTSPPITDLAVQIYSDWASRPGFDKHYYVNLFNLGTTDVSGITLHLRFPGWEQFISSDPVGTVLDSVITWTVPLMQASPSPLTFSILIHIPVGIPHGTSLIATASVDAVPNEIVLTNNFDDGHDIVVSSVDPNDMLVQPPGCGPNGNVTNGSEPLTYNIQFENKSTATAEAIYVWVVDTLDADLDWNTLQLGPSINDNVLSVNFNSSTGELIWFFDGINLPPNVTPPQGEGFVAYTVTPKPGLPDGTVISSRAHIRFDYNEWIAAPGSGPLTQLKFTTCPCNCPMQGDLNSDALIDVFDVIGVIGIAFTGDADPQDSDCPKTRGDANNDGVSDVFDVIYLIATAFSGGPNPVDPCAP